jgi:hypothetical protein
MVYSTQVHNNTNCKTKDFKSRPLGNILLIHKYMV